MNVTRSFHRWLHTRVRTFRNREIEHEFRAVFRSAGVRFFELGTAVTGVAFLAFFLIFMAARPDAPFAQPQPARLIVAATFLFTAALCRFAKPFVLRHYEALCASTIFVGILSTSWIGSMVPLTEGLYSRFWGMYSAAVFATCIIFGFTRLSLGMTLLLALANCAVVVTTAAQYQPDGKMLQRLIVHLTAINVMCFVLYRLIGLRERKLFIRAKRQRGINAIKRARDKAEEASRAKSVFLANMSHEIRTPMNGIIGSLALIERSDSPDQRRQLLAIARQSADGLLQTLNEILDYAKLDAKRSALHLAPLSPIAMCEAAVQTFQANATSKGIRLTLDTRGFPQATAHLLGDEEKLRRAIMNLVSNAVKFTSMGGVTVKLRGARVDGGIRLTIRVVDTGIGIPNDKIGLLFDPFYQVESSMARAFTGTGLGLAISKQLLEAMGGSIRATSKLGSGSEFTMELVMRECDAPLVEARATSRRLSAEDEALIRGRSVLLVEDNEVNALIALATLESLGVSALHATDGEESLRLFSERTFDVVLMDCQMPGMDGFAATGRVRDIEAASGQPRTPVIALTGNALSGDREACLAHDMDDYLSKPIDLHELGGKLAFWIAKSERLHELHSTAHGVL